MRYADEIVDNPGVRTLEEQLAGLEVDEFTCRSKTCRVSGIPKRNWDRES
jgi:hypothetical protein